MNDKWINVMVTASNLIGLWPIAYANGWMMRIWISMVVAASMLMHLSETKHGLRGIHPFNKYARKFLWLDRVMAWSLAIYAVLSGPFIIYSMLLDGLILPAFVFLAISEFYEKGVLNKPNMHTKMVYANTHSLWHIAGYCYILLYLKRSGQ